MYNTLGSIKQVEGSMDTARLISAVYSELQSDYQALAPRKAAMIVTDAGQVLTNMALFATLASDVSDQIGMAAYIYLMTDRPGVFETLESAADGRLVLCEASTLGDELKKKQEYLATALEIKTEVPESLYGERLETLTLAMPQLGSAIRSSQTVYMGYRLAKPQVTKVETLRRDKLRLTFNQPINENANTVDREEVVPDGSAVRLTVARYYTPTGRSIQKPYSDGTESYNRELLSRYEHNELFSADSIHFADSLKYVTEGGKVVYGGGGIMPDIFVPADTSDMTPYFREVAGRNILYRFTLDYTDRHRAQLNGIRTLEELDRFFGSQPDLLGEFVRYAARQGVAPKPAEIERSKEVMLAQIKAYVGRNTPLEDNAFYHNIQSIDNVVKQALEVLSAPRPDNELHVRDTVARTEPSL